MKTAAIISAFVLISTQAFSQSSGWTVGAITMTGALPLPAETMKSGFSDGNQKFSYAIFQMGHIKSNSASMQPPEFREDKPYCTVRYKKQSAGATISSDKPFTLMTDAARTFVPSERSYMDPSTHKVQKMKVEATTGWSGLNAGGPVASIACAYLASSPKADREVSLDEAAEALGVKLSSSSTAKNSSAPIFKDTESHLHALDESVENPEAN